MDLLDNLPRLRLSRDHMQLVLWVMKEAGARDVPSVYQLRNVQKNLKKSCAGIQTRRFRSDLGNIFYVNDLAQIIAQVRSNLCERRCWYSFIGRTMQTLTQLVCCNHILKNRMACTRRCGRGLKYETWILDSCRQCVDWGSKTTMSMSCAN